MYKQEEIKPYDTKGDKGEQVEQMFDSIADAYDTLNHRLSWNIDRYWRKKAIKYLMPYKPQEILDVATGTGDFAIQSSIILKPQRLLGIDISENMMKVGQRKVEENGLQGIVSFKKEDCLSLSLQDNTFDAVTAAFGIRNFSNLEKGLSEMCRVLRPGGQLCIIELTEPISFPMKYLFRLYSHTILPIYGRIISKDKNAYSYLTKTIEAFPQGEQMKKILAKVGLVNIDFKRLTFGICTMYYATK